MRPALPFAYYERLLKALYAMRDKIRKEVETCNDSKRLNKLCIRWAQVNDAIKEELENSKHSYRGSL